MLWFNNLGRLGKLAVLGGSVLGLYLCFFATVALISIITDSTEGTIVEQPVPPPTLSLELSPTSENSQATNPTVSTHTAIPSGPILEMGGTSVPSATSVPVLLGSRATEIQVIIENAPVPTLVPAPSATNSPPTSNRYAIVDLKGFEWVYVRDLTRADFPQIATIDQAGSQLVVLGRTFDSTWISVQLNDGRIGWMAREYLFIQEFATLPIVTPPFLPETSARVTLKTYDWINVRDYPSLSAAVIYEIRDSYTTFSALGLSNDDKWVFVRLQDGRKGWIAREFVVPEQSLERFPRRAP